MTQTRSYRPGDWFGIFGDQATVVLPPSEKARVPALWALVDAGAGFDEVLDALIADGLRDLPGFVLVSEADGETKVVLRGAATAVFTTSGETVTVEGSSVTTWAERSLSDVQTMRIDVADGPDGPDLVIRDGLVRISRTDRPAYLDAGGATDDGEVTDEGFEVIGGDDVAPDVNVMDETALHPGPVPLSEPVPEPVPEPEPEPEPEVGAETPLTDDPPTNPQEPADGSHDGLTQAANWGSGEAARSQPGIPGQPPAPLVLAQPVARLTFSSGEVVEVDRAVIVGRAPEARRFTSTEQPRLVTVPSPNQEISSTHLEIRPGAGADHGSAVATDLGSTNGTVLQQPGLPAEDLRPGIAVQLVPGAIIDLGDGVTIQVGQA
ncbi:MAG TPA: FHA domain-containing protein [Nocardioides sp.]|nr:FHA domain-containing protein [Nocardioides sp.]